MVSTKYPENCDLRESLEWILKRADEESACSDPTRLRLVILTFKRAASEVLARLSRPPCPKCGSLPSDLAEFGCVACVWNEGQAAREALLDRENDRAPCTLENCGHMRQLDAIVDLLGMPRGGVSVVDYLRARNTWEDKKDEWTDAIRAAHPTRSESHDEWGTAMRMVGHRHSKGELVALVNWLLVSKNRVGKQLQEFVHGTHNSFVDTHHRTVEQIWKGLRDTLGIGDGTNVVEEVQRQRDHLNTAVAMLRESFRSGRAERWLAAYDSKLEV